MEVGDKVALHNVLFPDRTGQQPDEFTIVTITDKRIDVPGYFGDGNMMVIEAKTSKVECSSFIGIDSPMIL